MNSEGDFTTTNQALNFILKYQREDGKIPHEIAQGASFVNWFKDYPYAFASADATPLYLIAVNDYVKQSGDTAFVTSHWNSLWRAYTFLKSTYDENDFPQNIGVGHGWIEGGPLLPVNTELYQSGLGAAALHALSQLAAVSGHKLEAKQLASEYQTHKRALDETFWSAEKQSFAFALDQKNKRVDTTTVLTTPAMWFGVLDEAKSIATIGHLAAREQQTDWGMRIISNQHPLYSGGGYHFGSVWPLFTGWASVAEYGAHQDAPAYANLRANALLAVDGAPGHVTEVLSGDYYQSLSTSSPHQIWSAAMVVSPMLRGMMGLRTDAAAQTITFAPAIPADWNSFAIRNIQVGQARVDISFRRSSEEIVAEIHRTGSGDCTLLFEPALSLRAKVFSIDWNGQPVALTLEPTAGDQHLKIRLPLPAGRNTLRVKLRHDFALTYSGTLPALGEPSQGLRIISQTWSADRESLRVQLQGMPGHTYTLSIFNPGEILNIDGASGKRDGEAPTLAVSFAPQDGVDSADKTLLIHFKTEKQ